MSAVATLAPAIELSLQAESVDLVDNRDEQTETMDVSGIVDRVFAEAEAAGEIAPAQTRPQFRLVPGLHGVRLDMKEPALRVGSFIVLADNGVSLVIGNVRCEWSLEDGAFVAEATEDEAPSIYKRERLDMPRRYVPSPIRTLLEAELDPFHDQQERRYMDEGIRIYAPETGVVEQANPSEFGLNRLPGVSLLAVRADDGSRQLFACPSGVGKFWPGRKVVKGKTRICVTRGYEPDDCLRAIFRINRMMLIHDLPFAPACMFMDRTKIADLHGFWDMTSVLGDERPTLIDRAAFHVRKNDSTLLFNQGVKVCLG